MNQAGETNRDPRWWPRRVLREPLAHFLVLGAALFAAYASFGRNGVEERDEIVVTRGQIEHLAAGFARFQRRPPSPEELEVLIRDHVRGEVYYREAISLGLDREDPVIRQRLRVKMEVLGDDVAALAEPTDEQLRAYLRDNADAFLIEPRYTFRHVFLDPQRRGDELSRDAAALLVRLARSGRAVDVAALGDPFLLDHGFEGMPASEVSRLFGESFAAQLADLPPLQWRGPIASGYGSHLVFVEGRTEPRAPVLEEVRDEVRQAWQNDERKKVNERFYAGLLSRYRITVQESPATGADAIASAAP